jgi:hypothetical protein
MRKAYSKLVRNCYSVVIVFTTKITDDDSGQEIV